MLSSFYPNGRFILFENAIMVTVSGRDHSGKGHLVAAIAHNLEQLGINVTVQCAESHNAKKLAMDDAAIAERLKDVKIVVTELRT
jgi:chromosomal replication initiation ATPase DnaA